MSIHALVQPGAFVPEVVAAMGEAFDTACIEQPAELREVIAHRIVAAAKLGVRDPRRLRAAGLALRPRTSARMRVVLSAGSEELVAVALDERAALAEAINLLSMQRGLRAGWKLTIEES